jgi:hypothetical protein
MWRLLAALLVLVPLVLLAVLPFFFYTCFNPADQIVALIVQIPADVDFVCIASGSGGRIDVMRWYYFTNISGFTERPGDRAFGSAYPGGADMETVAWITGERYGVITRTTDRQWSITWFEAKDVPVQGRGLYSKPARITFDLSKGRKEPLSEDTVKNQGLNQVPPREQ